MDFKGKGKLREATAEKLKKANSVIVAEYRGLTVEEVSALRVELRKSDAELKVVKNRVAKKAIEMDVPELDGIKDNLKGPVSLVLSYGDLAQTAKTVLEFEKDHDNLVVKAGAVENKAVSVADLKAIADLPSKDVMIGQIVGSLVSPHRGLIGVLGGVQRQLVQVINAIKDSKTA